MKICFQLFAEPAEMSDELLSKWVCFCNYVLEKNHFSFSENFYQTIEQIITENNRRILNAHKSQNECDY